MLGAELPPLWVGTLLLPVNGQGHPQPRTVPHRGWWHLPGARQHGVSRGLEEREHVA